MLTFNILRFSFVISKRGEITHVYHQSNDDANIIASKKGFAALFASRLHEKGDVILILLSSLKHIWFSNDISVFSINI